MSALETPGAVPRLHTSVPSLPASPAQDAGLHCHQGQMVPSSSRISSRWLSLVLQNRAQCRLLSPLACKALVCPSAGLLEWPMSHRICSRGWGGGTGASPRVAAALDAGLAHHGLPVALDSWVDTAETKTSVLGTGRGSAGGLSPRGRGWMWHTPAFSGVVTVTGARPWLGHYLAVPHLMPSTTS